MYMVLAKDGSLPSSLVLQRQRIEASSGWLNQVFEEYAVVIFRYIYRLTGDPRITDEIVGDTFAKLIDQVAVGKGPNSNLRSYLYETAYHQFVDDKRIVDRDHPADETIYEYCSDKGLATAAKVENDQINSEIVKAIKKDLPSKQRQVIILRFIEGFSLKETAKIMNIEVNYVKVIQNRAINRLRKALQISDGIWD